MKDTDPTPTRRARMGCGTFTVVLLRAKDKKRLEPSAACATPVLPASCPDRKNGALCDRSQASHALWTSMRCSTLIRAGTSRLAAASALAALIGLLAAGPAVGVVSQPSRPPQTTVQPNPAVERAREAIRRFGLRARPGHRPNSRSAVVLEGVLSRDGNERAPYVLRCRYPDACQIAYVLPAPDSRFEPSPRVFTVLAQSGWIAGRWAAVEEPYLEPGIPAPTDLRAVIGRREALSVALGVVPDWLLASGVVAMSYMRTASRGGVQVDELQVADADGPFATLAIDSRTHIPARLELQYVNLVPQRLTRSRGIGYASYRIVGSVLAPTRIERYSLMDQPTKVTGSITFETARTDVPVSEVLFRRPTGPRSSGGRAAQATLLHRQVTSC